MNAHDFHSNVNPRPARLQCAAMLAALLIIALWTSGGAVLAGGAAGAVTGYAAGKAAQ